MITLDTQSIEHIFTFRVKESVSLAYVSAKELVVGNEKSALFFSTLVSSIANSQGGIAFIGIKSQRKFAQKIEAIEVEHAQEWIQLICDTQIFPKIPQLEISAIQVSPSQFILGVRIPNSNKAPHMAVDNKFYKRVDQKAVLLEEYEIRDLYTKGKRPMLEVFSVLNTNGLPIMSLGKIQQVNFYPRFLVKNMGTEVEKYYKVEFSVPSQIINQNYNSLQDFFSRFEDGNSIFSITQKQPLFQNEIATVIETNIIVDAQTYDVFEKSEFRITLYHSCGIDSKSYNCKELLLYKNKKIESKDFVETQNSIVDSEPQLQLFSGTTNLD